MLIYHPAFDIYNCAFRMLQLLTYMDREEIEVDRLRIWDFYLTFPNEVRNIKFPLSLLELKKVFKKKEYNPYEDLIDAKRILDRMKSFQLSALKCLASYGLIDSTLLTRNVIKRTDKDIPDDLMERIKELTIEKENIIKLVVGFWELPLLGNSGIKNRTGLIDHKYDPK